MATKKQKENILTVLKDWVNVAEDGDSIRFTNDEIVIYNKSGCEINRQYV